MALSGIWRGLKPAAIITTLIGWAPMAALALCMAIASLTGCRVDEGSIHPCVVAGIDIGGLLYTLGVMGWLMLATFPIALVSIGLWLVLLLLWLKHHFSTR